MNTTTSHLIDIFALLPSALEITVHLPIPTIILPRLAIPIVTRPLLLPIMKLDRILINRQCPYPNTLRQLRLECNIRPTFAHPTNLRLVLVGHGGYLDLVLVLRRIGLLELLDVDVACARAVSAVVDGAVGVEAGAAFANFGDAAEPLLAAV